MTGGEQTNEMLILVLEHLRRGFDRLETDAGNDASAVVGSTIDMLFHVRDEMEKLDAEVG